MTPAPERRGGAHAAGILTRSGRLNQTPGLRKDRAAGAKPSFARVYTGQEVDDVPVGDLQVVEQVGVTAVGDLPEAGVDEVASM